MKVFNYGRIRDTYRKFYPQSTLTDAEIIRNHMLATANQKKGAKK